MKQILVTAGVIMENGRFLMARRMPGGPEGGKWEFPGGKVEEGEDPRACLARELREELGIDATVEESMDVISVVRPDRHLVLLYFAAMIENGSPQAIDCQQVAWLTPDEITSLDKPEADTIFWNRNKIDLLRILEFGLRNENLI